MSTLVAQTISNGTISTSSANVINGAKAWVNYNGVAQSIRASYNVSSVTRSASGVYVVNFTNAFADANYACVVSSGDSFYDSVVSKLGSAAYPPTFNTTNVRFISNNGSASTFDQQFYCVAIFR